MNFEAQSIVTFRVKAINRYPIKERMQSIINDMRFPNFDTVACAKINVQNPPTVPNVPKEYIIATLSSEKTTVSKHIRMNNTSF